MSLVNLLGRIGANQAIHLARITARPVAEVYAELVKEEARGRVRLVVEHNGHKSRTVKWEAMVPDDELPTALQGGALGVF